MEVRKNNPPKRQRKDWLHVVGSAAYNAIGDGLRPLLSPSNEPSSSPWERVSLAVICSGFCLVEGVLSLWQISPFWLAMRVYLYNFCGKMENGSSRVLFLLVAILEPKLRLLLVRCIIQSVDFKWGAVLSILLLCLYFLLEMHCSLWHVYLRKFSLAKV